MSRNFDLYQPETIIKLRPAEALPGGRPESQFNNFNGTIKATIVDELGEPLEGASIVSVEDNTKYSVAGQDGNVELSSLSFRDMIRVNYLGYEKEFMAYTIDFGGKIVVPSNSLDEIVINVPKKTNYLKYGAIGVSLLGLLLVLNKKKSKKIKL